MRARVQRIVQRGSSSMAVTAVLLIMLAISPIPSDSALNIGVDSVNSANGLLADLRRSIFVDVAHLAPRHERRCTSLDGPSCFGLVAQSGRHAPFNAFGELDSPGVLPERLLHDLGVQGSELEFSLPGYQSLEAIRQQLQGANGQRTGAHETALLEDAQSRASEGLLQFIGLDPDRRVPLSFSRGMPDGVVATWDGRWIARHCPLRSNADGGVQRLEPEVSELDSGSLSWPVPSKIGVRAADESAGVVVRSTGQLTASVSDIQATVEQISSLAYIRFSHPVLVRSLAARWSPEFSARPAMIGGRLGMQNIWTVHLDPGRLESDAWLDVSGGTLQPVDELVFMGTQGLELGAIWVAGQNDTQSANISERPVMLLEPIFNPSIVADDSRPKFRVRPVNLAPISAPFLWSVQEAIDAKLRLHSDLSRASAAIGLGASTYYPGLVANQLGHWQNQPSIMAQANQQMLEHRMMAQLHAPPSFAASAEAFVRSLRSTGSSPALPEDLRRDLVRNHAEIIEAMHAWSRNSGRMLSAGGRDSEIGDASSSYWRLRTAQAKLDIMTTAHLYARKF